MSFDQSANNSSFNSPSHSQANVGQSANGEPIATPAVRLGAYLLEILLVVVTLAIGWIIWTLIVWSKGTTPGHQVLRLYVVDEKTGKTATWGHMALREFVMKGIVGSVATAMTFGIYFVVDSLFIVRPDRRTLHDLISSTQVVQR
jgi:uncharacterized RDD family membrane protein YckC